MNNILIPSGRAIIFNYPAGAGGKLLQNCVSLSRHCILTSSESAEWQIRYKGTVDEKFYQYKFRCILASLPPPDRMNQWMGFELSERDLYGINWQGFNQHQPIRNQAVYQAADRGLWSTVSVHNWGSVEHYSQYWPELKHVCLVNNEQFSQFCLPIKNGQLTYDTNWHLRGRTPTEQCFEFDVDSTIWNTDQFVKQVAKLYDYLGFDDFQQDLITQYHIHYINLHL
jgi:hypothetical protein